MGAQMHPVKSFGFWMRPWNWTSAESYTRLLEHVQRKEVGAVGKIYYSNGPLNMEAHPEGLFIY